MTVSVGLLDPSGEVLVATDSRASDEKTMTLRDGALKSIRINDKCALAFSGSEAWANNLVANLFGLTGSQIAEGMTAIDYVEKNGLSIDNDPFIIAFQVDCILGKYRTGSEAGRIDWPALNVMLAGIDEPGPCLRVWTRKSAWNQNIINKRDGVANSQVFGPGEPKEAVDALSDLSVSVWERIHRVVEIYREICPCGVNLDISVRRAVDGFALKPLTGLRQPSSAPAQDSP